MQFCKKRILRCGILLLALLNQNSFAECLRDAIARTIYTNPDIGVVVKVREASFQQVKQAQSGYLPVFDTTASWGRERAENINTGFLPVTLWRSTFGVTFRQMIFDGFATRSEVARTKAKTIADAYKVWGTTDDTALLAVQAYLDVLRSQELVAIAERNLGVHQRTYSLVRKLSEQGVGREADTQQTYGRLELAKANIVTARNNLENAKVAYLKVTGRPPCNLCAPTEVNEACLPPTECVAVKLAIDNHPTLKSANADIAEARGQYFSAKSKFYPRLDFVMTGRHNHNTGGVHGPDDDRLAELQLQYNILQGGKDVARTNETAANIQQACEVRNRTYRQVIETMQLSWIAYKNSRERIPLIAAHLRAAAFTTNAYQKQFDLGKRTMLDVLDSQNEYYITAQDLVNERYAYMFAKYRILNGMGRVALFFNLELPCATRLPFCCKEICAHGFC